MAAMKDKSKRGIRWITAAWVTATAIILLLPLIAMQFTDEVNWTVSDFAFAGGMLIGAGIIYELAARAGNLAYQAAVVVASGVVILIMWTTGAVGIIGSEANPGNLVFVAVAALAILGAIVARGRAGQMAWVMAAVAGAQVLAPVVALIGIANPTSDVLRPEVFAATGLFTALWLLSAWLFRKATR